MYIKHSERLKLCKKIAGLKTTKVYWHEKLQNLDDSQFDIGLLKGMPKSKNVVRQLAHKFSKTLLNDLNVFKSLNILQKKLKMKRKSKFVGGFIQFLAYSPLLIGLWTRQDIELFYKLGSVHSLIADATANITVKLCKKQIFYFAFVIYNWTVKTEQVPILELLIDCPDERSLTCLLTSFLLDKQKYYGYKVKDHLERSFQIVTGKASSNHLPTMTDKKYLFVFV